MLNAERKEEIVHLAKALVAHQSYSGQEGDAARELEQYMRPRL